MITLLACAWIDDREAGIPYDRDGDGLLWTEDCDDLDPERCGWLTSTTEPPFPGTDTGTPTSPDPGSLPPADRLMGVGAGDHFGVAVSAGLDATHDGVPDLLVGAPGTGQAWFVEAGWSDNNVGNVGIPLGSGGDCGTTVLLAPDVDGDSLGEALVSCPDQERVERWWPGGDRRGTWALPAPPGALAGVGAKLVIALPTLERVVQVPVGAYGAVDAADGIAGLWAGDGFGEGLVVGDYDGSGVLQLAVIAPAGRRLDLFTQPFALSAADAPGSIALGGAEGQQVADAGDVDGDGTADLVTADPTKGTLNFFHAPGGDVGPSAAFVAFFGGEAGFADRVAGVGDLDGDGVGDLLVASPTGEEGAGVLWLLNGPIGQSPTRRYTGPEGSAAGTTLARAGDRDGDGRPEVLVSGVSGEHGVVWLIDGEDW